MPAPPPLDSRSYDQLVAYLSNRIQADTGWKPPADGSQDVG